MDRKCAVARLFRENSARRTHAREDGKRETKENAIELVIENKIRKYGLHSVKRTGPRQIKLATMKMKKNENLTK